MNALFYQHKMSQVYFSFLLFASLVMLCTYNINSESIFTYAEPSTSIDALADSYVDEGLPGKKFGNGDNLAVGWANTIHDDGNRTIDQVLSYIKFPLDKIPESTDNEIITIDAIKLKISIENKWWLENNKHALVIYPCFDNSWNEEYITWNTRPCKELKNPIHHDLDESISKDNQSNSKEENLFNITNMIKNAKEQNWSEITLVLSSYSTDIGRIDHKKNPGLIWMSSLESKDQGTNKIPKLDVQYTVEKKELTLYEKIIVVY